MIVGTAGHIDHGKTSLVRSLTGVETDRLKEEKARGITIELGFAYLPRPGGETLGFVDVPGHERLVHTMLSGATGIDFVILVIAADDGVMPQTREHLAILDLLGLDRGVIALTKADLAGNERRTEAETQIRAAVAGTGLEAAEIIPVSSVTGEGVAALLARLDDAAKIATRRHADRRFRLAIDRSFSLAGAGTVVTGTVLSGAVAVGDKVVVAPQGLEARVRSVHAQNKAAQRGVAGERCALALVGAKIDPQSVTRGAVVIDPSLLAPVKRIDVSLTLLASEKKPAGQWMPVKFHHGSTERDARLLALGDADGARGLAPGQTGFAQIVLDGPAQLAAGDRFVLRDSAASRTIGGGVILDLRAPERQRTTPERLAELAALMDADPANVAASLLAGRRGCADLTAFARDRALPESFAEATMRSCGLIGLQAGGALHAMLPARWDAFAAEVVRHLAAFHAEKPDLPGLGQERLRLGLTPRLAAPVFAAALARLVSAGTVVLDRSWVRLPGHEVRLSDEEERLWARIRPLLTGGERFRPPRVRDIAKLHKIDEAFVRRLFKLAARRGDVDEIAQDHYFLAGTVIEMASIARALAAASPSGEFSVIAFRDRLDNGRKVAIQILEFFDRQGLTMRRGDIRRVNPHRSELFSIPQPADTSPAVADGGETSPVGRPDFKSGEGRETALGGFDSCLLRQTSSGASR